MVEILILGNQVNAEELKGIVANEHCCSFLAYLEGSLCISNSIERYPIKFGEYKLDTDGFTEVQTFASLSFSEKYKDVLSFNLYLEAITDEVNRKFVHRIRLPEVIQVIAMLLIYNAIAHEYVHIKQHEEGRLTQEVMDLENQIDYKQRGLEIEASLRSQELVIGFTGIEPLVLGQIISENIDNDNASTIEHEIVEWLRNR